MQLSFKKNKLRAFFKFFNLKVSILLIKKYLDFRKYKPTKIYRYSNYIKNQSAKTLEYFNYKKFNFGKIHKYLNLQIRKYLNYQRYKKVSLYFFCAIILSALVYLNLPLFYNFDQSKIENVVCKGFKLKCEIQGKIKYNFFPTPRIKFKNLIIKDSINKYNHFAKVKDTQILISIINLQKKEDLNFLKIKFVDSIVNLDMNKFENYKNIFSKKHNSLPIIFRDGEIKFFDKKKHIAVIKKIDMRYQSNKNITEMILKGRIIGDDLSLVYKDKKNNSKIFTLKLSNLGLSAKVEVEDQKNDVLSGNFSFKKDKNKLLGIFDKKKEKIIIKHSNLRNPFLDGKIDGEIKFLPFFDFDLNLNLNSLNFNKLYTLLSNLNEEERKKLFKINKKINGKVNLNINKIFSKHTLINSLESEIKFINGDIYFERALLNLGKLGAADLYGAIKNDKKFTNFKFEKNIFVDNLKKFYNKFNIYNKEKVPYSLFVSGVIDLTNFNLRLNEISSSDKFKEDDVLYIEKEFNDILLEDGYSTLLNFKKIKEFMQLVATETN